MKYIGKRGIKVEGLNEILNRENINVEELTSISSSLIRQVIHYTHTGEICEDLQELLSNEKLIHNTVKGMSIIKDNIVLQTSYLLGILQSIIWMVGIYDDVSEVSMSKQDLDNFCKNKNFKEILNIVYYKNSISHQELAGMLGIKFNSLYRIMKIMIDYNVVSCEKYDSCRYYYSNSLTRELYHYLNDKVYHKMSE